MITIHEPTEVTTWKPTDVTALIGKHLHVQAADASYWSSDGVYDGRWDDLGAGVVADAEMCPKRENVHLVWRDGGSTRWIVGQAIYVTEFAE